MAYDRETADRVRRLLAARGDVVEKRMVGGISFAVHGRMCCGVTSSGLMVRVDPGQRSGVLAEPHVSPMELGRRPLTAFVVIAPAGYSSDAALGRWLRRGIDVVRRDGGSGDAQQGPHPR